MSMVALNARRKNSSFQCEDTDCTSLEDFIHFDDGLASSGILTNAETTEKVTITGKEKDDSDHEDSPDSKSYAITARKANSTLKKKDRLFLY